MPKPKTRKKSVYTPPPKAKQLKVTPRWLVPAMLFFLVLGLAWIATYYIANASDEVTIPVLSDLGNWNLGIGFASIIVGLVLATKWR